MPVNHVPLTVTEKTRLKFRGVTVNSNFFFGGGGGGRLSAYKSLTLPLFSSTCSLHLKLRVLFSKSHSKLELNFGFQVPATCSTTYSVALAEVAPATLGKSSWVYWLLQRACCQWTNPPIRRCQTVYHIIQRSSWVFTRRLSHCILAIDPFCNVEFCV